MSVHVCTFKSKLKRKGRKEKSDSFGPKQPLFIMNGGVIMKELGHLEKNKLPRGRQLRMAASRALHFRASKRRSKDLIYNTSFLLFFFSPLSLFFFL